jgi:hypothetical protein
MSDSPFTPAESAPAPFPAPPARSGLSTAFLDSLRGFASFYVVFHHTAMTVYNGYYLQKTSFGIYRPPPGQTEIGKLLTYLMALFSFGPAAVVFFFVLSGFVIHLRSATRLQQTGESGFHWSQYILRRARRLYPPLLMALALTAVIDHIGIRLNLPIYSGHTAYPLLNRTLTSDFRLSTLIGNICFLNKLYVPTFGSDSPLLVLELRVVVLHDLPGLPAHLQTIAWMDDYRDHGALRIQFAPPNLALARSAGIASIHDCVVDGQPAGRRIRWKIAHPFQTARALGRSIAVSSSSFHSRRTISNHCGLGLCWDHLPGLLASGAGSITFASHQARLDG